MSFRYWPACAVPPFTAGVHRSSSEVPSTVAVGPPISANEEPAIPTFVATTLNPLSGPKFTFFVALVT